MSKLGVVARWTVVAFAVAVGVAVISTAVVAATLPACRSCHSSGRFAEQTRAGAHASVGCATCHVKPGVTSRLTFASNEIFVMALGIGREEGHGAAAVTDKSCLGCHQDVLGRIVESKGFKIAHGKCAKGSACSDCHSGTAHGAAVQWPRFAEMDRCVACHTSQNAPTACDTCHATKSEAERLGSGTWAATHGSNWKTAHGMGDWLTCSICHAQGYCARCHGIDLPHGPDFIVQHSTVALASAAPCTGCHAQAFCNDCHGIQMPHSVSFVRRHSKDVAEKGEPLCLRCHVRGDCTGCHQDHVHPGGAVVAPASGR